VTAPHWPFSSDSWGADIDDTVELRAQTADLWQEFPVYRLRVGVVVGRVSLMDDTPLPWAARIRIGGNVRDLGWFHTADEGKAAVEQVIGELAGET
jgi:hypothetical protein